MRITNASTIIRYKAQCKRNLLSTETFSWTWRQWSHLSDREQRISVSADKILGRPHWAQKSVSEGHNLFCHDRKPHCKMRILTHWGVPEKTENFKLNAIHNTRKRRKLCVASDMRKHLWHYLSFKLKNLSGMFSLRCFFFLTKSGIELFE